MDNQLTVIIKQAKLFLDDSGEFYPFGTVVNADGSLSPVGVQLDNDNPGPMEVFEILQESIRQRLRKREIIAAAICLDVLYRPPGSEAKIDSLKVMTLTNEGQSVDYFVPYQNKNGEYIFGEIISESGTLKLE